MLFFAYANMGFLAGLTALMCAARFNSAAPSAGNNYELDAIASCFIGGASAYGGTGTVAGAVIGAIFMGVLNQGMSIVGIDANWQRAVKGLVLLSFIIGDCHRIEFRNYKSKTPTPKTRFPRFLREKQTNCLSIPK
jgi:putative multiple sugar transport system permease protein